MKLRIYRNSLRFRLTPADVALLDSTGTVTERISFGPGAEFSYSLCARAKLHAMRATFQGNTITVEIPGSMVHDWSGSEKVGISHTQHLGDGKNLEILIEKDFECLEGQMDNPDEVFYPNPNKACLVNEPAARG